MGERAHGFLPSAVTFPARDAAPLGNTSRGSRNATTSQRNSTRNALRNYTKTITRARRERSSSLVDTTPPAYGPLPSASRSPSALRTLSPRFFPKEATGALTLRNMRLTQATPLGTGPSLPRLRTTSALRHSHTEISDSTGSKRRDHHGQPTNTR